MESYVRIGGRGLKNLTYPYMGVREVKNCQNHPYVINEWPLNTLYLKFLLEAFHVLECLYGDNICIKSFTYIMKIVV